MSADPYRELIDWCGATNTHQLLILDHGETVVEEFWQGADADSTRDIGSMQKGLSAIVLGQLIGEGLLRLDDPLSAHVGEGWTRTTPEQETDITIRHVVSMTSGLNDDFEWDCEPGTDWYYCNFAYHQVRKAMEMVTRHESGPLFEARLLGPLGMHKTTWRARPEMTDPNGWAVSGVHTTGRDMAIFGQAVLERRGLNCSDEYFDDMIAGASAANPSYGRLWWVYGGATAVVPGHRRGQIHDPKKRFGGIQLDRRISASAPSDVFGVQGAGDQHLYVVPSRQLVAVRLGEPTGSVFDEAFWSRFPKEHM